MMIWSDGYEKQYKGVLVRCPRFTINQRVTIIKGENGSGKSTVLKAIAGLIKIKGKIYVEGTVSYLPEKMEMVPELTTRFYLDSMCGNDNNMMLSLIHDMMLTPHLDKPLNTLSKGMHQKVRLVQALSQDKDMFLLDEPFNGLDDQAVQQLQTLIETSDKKFVISTHLDITVPAEVIQW